MGYREIKRVKRRCWKCNKEIIATNNGIKYCNECKVRCRKKAWERYNRKIGYKKYIIKKCYFCKKKFRSNQFNNNILCNVCGNRKRVSDCWAKKHNCKNVFTQKELMDLLRNTRGRCEICNKMVGYKKLTIDHIINLSMVEMDFEITDMRWICASCNSKKNYLRRYF